MQKVAHHTAVAFHIVWLMLGLSGCANLRISPLSCEYIVDTHLKGMPLTTLDESTLPKWVEQAYGISQQDMKSGRYGDNVGLEWTWEYQGRDYGAYLWPDARSVHALWTEVQPNIGEIVKCLGAPQYYQAYYQFYIDAYEYQVALWYPQLGMVASTHTYNREAREVALTPATTLAKMVRVPGGSLEQMVHHLYTPLRARDSYADKLKTLKPWPGRIEDMRVDIPSAQH